VSAVRVLDFAQRRVSALVAALRAEPHIILAVLFQKIASDSDPVIPCVLAAFVFRKFLTAMPPAAGVAISDALKPGFGQAAAWPRIGRTMRAASVAGAV
jgi:hypothetical protein